MRTFEKIVLVFCVIVFLTFMCNHGHIDFSGVDLVHDKTVEAINSEEGQAYIEETKSISKDLLSEMLKGLRRFLFGHDEENNEENGDLHSATLIKCIDGDTLKVKMDGSEITVRLIGIDTPESINPDESKNNEYGRMASDYTKTLLDNTETVYLEYDVESTDKYGRTLAYVWLADNTEDIENYMLNAILVKNGYADNMVIIPNVKYADTFEKLKKSAVANKAGLWQYDGYIKLREEQDK